MSKLDEIIEKFIYYKDESSRIDPLDMHWLCTKAIHVLMEQPTLLNLSSPITIVGDIHGQFSDLLRILGKGGNLPGTNYLFLGDYVDRGPNSIETIGYLLALKVKYPQNIWLLRGNHETREISKLYGFYDECVAKYNEDIWLRFNDVFMWLPLAATISQRIFCVHGGLSPQLVDLFQIVNLSRPLAVSDEGMVSDLLWSDPSTDNSEWANNDRGVSFTYGINVVNRFLQKYDFDLMCRAHQVVEEGYQFPFYPEQNLVTIFSAPNYCNEYRNKGAIMKVDDALCCNFVVIETE